MPANNTFTPEMAHSLMESCHQLGQLSLLFPDCPQEACAHTASGQLTRTEPVEARTQKPASSQIGRSDLPVCRVAEILTSTNGLGWKILTANTSKLRTSSFTQVHSEFQRRTPNATVGVCDGTAQTGSCIFRSRHSTRTGAGVQTARVCRSIFTYTHTRLQSWGSHRDLSAPHPHRTGWKVPGSRVTTQSRRTAVDPGTRTQVPSPARLTMPHTSCTHAPVRPTRTHVRT